MEANEKKVKWKELAGFGILLFFVLKFFNTQVFENAIDSFRNNEFTGFSFVVFFAKLSFKNSLIVLLPLAVPFLFNSKHQQLRKLDRPLMILNTISILIFVWVLCFETYDFYYNSWFGFDRLLIFICASFTFFRFSFIVPLIVYGLIFYAHYFSIFDWQYSHEIKPVFNILFISSLLVIPSRRFVKQEFIFLFALVAIMSSYFLSAIGKISMSPNGIEWVMDNELFLLPLNGMIRGWNLGSFQPLVHTAVELLKGHQILVSAFILLVEFLCLLALASRRLAKVLLIALFVMHIFIGTFVGLIFWAWALVDLLFIIILFVYPSSFVDLGKYKAPISVVLILFGLFVFKPFVFAWFDSRFQWFTEINVVDVNSNRYTLDKNDFGGYSFLFAHDYLQHSIPLGLPGDNGYCGSYDEVSTLRNYEIDNSNILSLLSKAPIRFQPEWDKSVQSFLNSYLKHRNLASSFAINYGCHAPRQLYMFGGSEERLKTKVTIKEVELNFKIYFYKDNVYESVLDTMIWQRSIIEY